jgi:enoyl-CoA hydratase/carnithine racemase
LILPAESGAVVSAPAGMLASTSLVIIRLGKGAMFGRQDVAFAEAIEFLRSRLTPALSTENIEEGVKAFLEKRKPVWEGR